MPSLIFLKGRHGITQILRKKLNKGSRSILWWEYFHINIGVLLTLYTEFIIEQNVNEWFKKKKSLYYTFVIIFLVQEWCCSAVLMFPKNAPLLWNLYFYKMLVLIFLCVPILLFYLYLLLGANLQTTKIFDYCWW